MVSKNFLIFVLLIILLSTFGSAAGLSVNLKRTNPGIAGIKPSEIIFDIVNTDIDHKIEGFILCRSPDDVTMSSTLGLASGSGSQYISPLFNIDSAPSQKSVYFLIESNYPRDYTTDCILKYIPYRLENNNTVYLKMNLDYTTSVKDSDYRQLRLNKNIPMIGAKDSYISAYCPRGKSTCTAEEVIISTYHEQNYVFRNLTIMLIILICFMSVIIIKNKQRIKRSKN